MGAPSATQDTEVMTINASANRIVRRGAFVAAAAVAIAVPTASATGGSSGGHPVGSGATPLAQSGKAIPSAAADEGKRSIDVRADATGQPVQPADPAATAKLRSSLGSEGILELDPATGTPRFLGRLDGFLTGPSSGSPQDVALSYARRNAAALGLSASDLTGLRLTRNYTDADGTTHLIWAQSAGGVEAFENGLYANVDKDGRLINLMGSPVRRARRHPQRRPGHLGPGRARDRVGQRRRRPAGARCAPAPRARIRTPTSPAPTAPVWCCSPRRPATRSSPGT